MRGDLLYLKRWSVKGEKFPWLGFPLSIYLSGKKRMMAELEPFSSVTELEPGESFTFGEEWYLLKLGNTVTCIDELPAVKKLIEKENG